MSDEILREERFHTENGILIASYPNRALHSFCLCLYAKAGPMYESEKENGMSHFIEHTVFRNTNYLMSGQLYEMLEALGLKYNASTYKEFVQFSITGTPDKFGQAAVIISKVLSPFRYEIWENGDVELERKRIRAEIRECDEKNQLDMIVKKKAWQDTPLANMITGTWKNVKSFNYIKTEKARSEMFSAGNFFFYLTGNVSPSDIETLAGIVESQKICDTAPKRLNCVGLPTGYGKRNGEILFKRSSYYKVEFCFDADTGAISKPCRNLFFDMMFEGDNCRFFKRMSDDLGYIYSYDAYIEDYLNCGNICFSYEVAHKDLYASLEEAVRICRTMKENADGLSKAKVYYTDSALVELDSAEDLNWDMAYENFILDENISSITERRERYKNISEKDITDAAGRIFRYENLTFGIKGEKDKISEERIKEILCGID